MDDRYIPKPPASLPRILESSAEIGFALASEPQTGALLRTLAAAKPGGRLLELGTGTGVATAWLLDGMDAVARLDSVDSDPAVLAIARRHLGQDARVRFHQADGAEFLSSRTADEYDLIFADAWAGKYTHLDLAFTALRVGGIYVVDDLLPQPNWPEGHAARVPSLIEEIERRNDLISTKLAWASGLLVVVRRG